MQITHRARSIQNCFTEHQSDFQYFLWPPHSPDLNPIENVRDMVERLILQHSPLPSNLQDLKSCIANAWYSLDVNALQKHGELDAQTNQSSYSCKMWSNKTFSHLFGIVVSDADCGAVGSGSKSRVRNGCLCCNSYLLCDVCFTLTSMLAPV
ncbi:hypothetical protein TNCV_1742241 [Trichonephila clavipes]|nr:hypothetical protein TNCV_1742241 [Trichonephila clavipes]